MGLFQSGIVEHQPIMTGCSLQVIQRIILGCQIQIYLVTDISFQLYGFDLVSDFMGSENENRCFAQYSAFAPNG